MTAPAPTGLKATTGLELLTYLTPNGYKATIMMEELRAAYPDTFPEYTVQSINIQTNIQKEPWYVDLCANGRIPVLVDHNRKTADGKPVSIWEGIAILNYLSRRYDPDHKIGFAVDSDEYDEAEVWMGWQHGGVGPMQGQVGAFVMFAPVEVPFAAQRYVGETERLYGILDKRLSTRDYVVGGRFSPADIALLPWAQGFDMYLEKPLEEMFPHLAAWRKRCLARPGAAAGMKIPAPSPFSFGLDSPEYKAAAEKSPFLKALPETMKKGKALIKRGKEEFGYVYKSP